MLRRSISSTTRLCSDKLFIHRDTPLNNASIPFNLTPENLTRAKEIISHYPPQYKKAADLAQRQNNNFCSLSVMNTVAGMLDMPPMRVYEVATFYTMFNRDPVGKYFLQVCTTTPCELCGASGIVDAIKKELDIDLNGTTFDGLFTLVEVECAGGMCRLFTIACVNAPVVAINDDYFEDLTPKSIVQLLRDIKEGKKVKAGPQSGRLNCENSAGKTNLTGPVPGPGHGVRSDL